MRHSSGYRKLGRDTAHRKSMLRGLSTALVLHERIKTTLPRAKELRSMVEKCVTRGKNGTVAARRQVRKILTRPDAIKKLFDDLAVRFKDRAGGYTRIYRIGSRVGDKAQMALIEFVDYTHKEEETNNDNDKSNKDNKHSNKN